MGERDKAITERDELRAECAKMDAHRDAACRERDALAEKVAELESKCSDCAEDYQRQIADLKGDKQPRPDTPEPCAKCGNDATPVKNEHEQDDGTMKCWTWWSCLHCKVGGWQGMSLDEWTLRNKKINKELPDTPPTDHLKRAREALEGFKSSMHGRDCEGYTYSYMVAICEYLEFSKKEHNK
jgi:hypothetical protein